MSEMSLAQSETEQNKCAKTGGGGRGGGEAVSVQASCPVRCQHAGDSIQVNRKKSRDIRDFKKKTSKNARLD